MPSVPVIKRPTPPADSNVSRLGAAETALGHGKLTVLISAEACNPSWSSVPLIGYNLTRALAERDDLEVTLVTNARNRDALEADPINARAQIHYVDNDFIAGPLFRFARKLRGGISKSWSINTAMMWPGYIAYERMVLRAFGRDLRRGRFDLIHRVTPLTPVLGSPLTSWSRVPMVIGPLNGGLPWPGEFSHLRREEKEWLIPLRRLHAMLPYHRSTFRRAAGLISASRHTEDALPAGNGQKLYLPENGVDPTRFPLVDEWRPPTGPFHFITVGRLAPVKAIDLIIQSIGGSDLLRACRLTVVGDGPEREKLESLTRDHGLQDVVRFVGWLDQSTLSGLLRDSHAFVFPSVKDFGGGAVLEAMASALPSIVCDYGGPAELVDSESGIVMPLEPVENLVVSIRRAMETLAADHTLCARLGAAAARRVRDEFIWSAKAERIAAFYRQVLAPRKMRAGADRPGECS